MFENDRPAMMEKMKQLHKQWEKIQIDGQSSEDGLVVERILVQIVSHPILLGYNYRSSSLTSKPVASFHDEAESLTTSSTTSPSHLHLLLRLAARKRFPALPTLASVMLVWLLQHPESFRVLLLSAACHLYPLKLQCQAGRA